MRTVPESIDGMISFFQTHAGVWKENAARLKIDPEAADRLQMLVAQAKEAAGAKRLARAAARSATLHCDNVAAELAACGAGLIATIRAVAKGGDDPGLFAVAQLSPPKTPGPVAAPGRPHTERVQLRSDGSLRLTWRCKNPRGSSGTRYEIRRSVDRGAFVHVGAVGKKSFVDTTIPPGSGALLYEVRAVRGVRQGAPAIFTVNFGARQMVGMRRAA
jgi:hypothetical protein